MSEIIPAIDDAAVYRALNQAAAQQHRVEEYCARYLTERGYRVLSPDAVRQEALAAVQWADLSTRARKVLLRIGATLETLKEVGVQEARLRETKNCGDATVNEIRGWCQRQGVPFVPEEFASNKE